MDLNLISFARKRLLVNV